MELSSSYQDLGGPRPRIVLGGHAEAISAYVKHSEKIVALQGREEHTPAQHIRVLANRTGHIHRSERPSLVLDWNNAVSGPVQTWAEKIVHPRINDQEGSAMHAFLVQDLGEEDPGRAHQRSPRF